MGILGTLFGGGGGTLKASTPVRLSGSGRVSVVGESHYQPALKAAAKGRAIRDLADAVPVDVVLAPEPTNRFDRNAVAVHVQGRTVGYLPRDLAAQYQPTLMQLAHRGEYGWCTGRIMGGGRGRSYGIHLHLGGPGPDLLFANSCDGLDMVEADRRVTITGFDHTAAPYPVGPDGRLPTLAASLALGTVGSGKYAGQRCLDVAIDGRRVGCFTAKMTERYLPLVHPMLDTGRVPGCEVTAHREGNTVKAWALMPRV